MSDRPKPLGKPNPKLPVYKPDEINMGHGRPQGGRIMERVPDSAVELGRGPRERARMRASGSPRTPAEAADQISNIKRRMGIPERSSEVLKRQANNATKTAKAAVRSNSLFSKVSGVVRAAAKSPAGRIATKIGAKLTGRVLIPLGVASDVVATVGAGTEGVRALKAKHEANQNEAYMKKHYGTVEAATKTRHDRNSKATVKAKIKNSNLKQGYQIK